MLFLPLDDDKRKAAEAIVERVVRDEGLTILGWRDIPHIPSACGDIARRGMPAFRQVFIGKRRLDARCGLRSSASSMSSANARPTKRSPRSGCAIRSCSTSAVCRAITIVYKGQLISTQIPEFFPDLIDPEAGQRACDGASALLHQHLPELGPRASVSLRRAQRRNQHAARQHQLDACAREAVRLAAVRRRHPQAPSDHRADRQRHRDVRQLRRAADSHRPLAATRSHDDDPRGMAERSADESGQARVLRVPLLHDGAVGRSRLDHVHRRRADRRGARSQRPAPLALPGHQGRLRGDGVGDRRPRHPA